MNLNTSSNKEVIVLGIDPGLIVAGFAVIKKEFGRAFLLDSGIFKMRSTQSVAVRVRLFHDFIREKIAQWHITHIALETPFLGKNSQSFLKLGYLRGIIYLLSEQYKLELVEFSPCQVKQAVTGFGGAQKEQVARMILKLFPSMLMPQKLDVTDALAVALCGVWHYRHKMLA